MAMLGGGAVLWEEMRLAAFPARCANVLSAGPIAVRAATVVRPTPKALLQVLQGACQASRATELNSAG